MTEVPIGYIIEHALFAIWSVSLFILYSKQLQQDQILEAISQLQHQQESITLHKIKAIGATALTFHIGGWAGSLVSVIRAIDPFPMLGILPFVATDLLSHIGIAILLVTLFEGIGYFTKKTYLKLVADDRKYFLQYAIRIITYCTFLVAIGTWVVENFVIDMLAYSAGVYFIYGTIVQWAVFILFSITIQIFRNKISSDETLTHDKIIRGMISKLRWIQFIFGLINIIVTIYQIYVFESQIRNKTTNAEINKETYSVLQAPLYVGQLISYTIILWVSYVRYSNLGDQTGLSEPSVTKQTYICQREKSSKSDAIEIVVKFKDDELNSDDRYGVTPGEFREINRESYIEPRKVDEVHSDQNLFNRFVITTQSIDDTTGQNDSFRSDGSNDAQITKEEYKRLMYLISEQEQAEREGRINEFLNERDSEENIALHRQIYAFRLQEQERISYLSQKNQMANMNGNKGAVAESGKSGDSLSDKSACSNDVDE
jgi:hypothetical protein